MKEDSRGHHPHSAHHEYERARLADMAWESSKTRIVVYGACAYLLSVLVLDGIGVPEPFVGSLVPALGYVVVLGALPLVKKLWIRRVMMKDRTYSPKELPDHIEIATFGAGQFWEAEEHFRKVAGVVDTVVGYMGGTSDSPTYNTVASGTTDHAQVVDVYYDVHKISYDELLDIFWSIHDPTGDAGKNNPYRSVVFYHTHEQKERAEVIMDELTYADTVSSSITTLIEPVGDFYKAEAYHQRYLKKHKASKKRPTK